MRRNGERMSDGIDWAKVTAEAGSALIVCTAVLSALPYKRKKISIIAMFVLNFVFYVCVQRLKEKGGAGNLAAPLADIAFSFVTIALFTKGLIWKNYLVFFLSVQCCNVGTLLVVLIFKACAQTMTRITDGIYNSVQGIVIAAAASVLVVIPMGLLFRHLLHPEIYDRERLYKCISIILIIGNVLEYYFRVYVDNFLRRETGRDRLMAVLSMGFMTACLVITLNVATVIYNRFERKRIQRETTLLESLAAENYSHYQMLADENHELRILRENHSGQAVRAYAEKLRECGQELGGFPLCGSMTIDALLCRYSLETAKKDVRFDAVVEPVLDIPVSEMELVSVLEYAMRAVYHAVGCLHGSRWMSVKLRFMNGMMLLMVEGSISQTDFWREDRRCIRLVQEMAENHSGVMNLTRDGIQVFIPNAEAD